MLEPVKAESLVKVIDLCGRQPPEIIMLTDLDMDDYDHILDMWDEGKPAYIGEFEYKEVSQEEATQWAA